MKIVLINKSDSTGGAAVVTYRLMEALRQCGHDARLLVVEKLTDSPYVEVCAGKWRSMIPFFAERLEVYFADGFSRKLLFMTDPSSCGLPLWRHPLVKDADAVILNWVNQGMLSISGVRKIASLGKPVVWTMHDMWNATGICHHAAMCTRYHEVCGNCPQLGKGGGNGDLSAITWKRKKKLYEAHPGIGYVAVSRWLRDRVTASSLLSKRDVRVIPNAFTPANDSLRRFLAPGDKIRIAFGAARLDDPIKGLGALVEMTRFLKTGYPELAQKLELVTFGGVRHPASLEGMAIPAVHLGPLHGEDKVREVYENAHILVSASRFETLPGTLVEAQAYGCIPVAFDSGGQRDIVEDGVTGFLFRRPDNDEAEAGKRLAEGVVKAMGVMADGKEYNAFLERMERNVADNFSGRRVAEAYLGFISELKGSLLY